MAWLLVTEGHGSILSCVSGSGRWWCDVVVFFIPIERCLNATAYLSLVADHVRPLMNTVYLFSDGYLEQDNAQSSHLKLEFPLLQWPPQSPALNPLGRGGMEGSHNGCAANESAGTA